MTASAQEENTRQIRKAGLLSSRLLNPGPGVLSVMPFHLASESCLLEVEWRDGEFGNLNSLGKLAGIF